MCEKQEVSYLVRCCFEIFSSGAVCMVLASDVYLKEDYIRDYQEFLKFRGV